MGKLSNIEQNEIVNQLGAGLESLTEEEFDDLYDQLDSSHQTEVNQEIRTFADNAVGSEHWDSDN
jgi:hypothetical protein